VIHSGEVLSVKRGVVINPITSGNWAGHRKSKLQKRIEQLPDVLNSCFGENTFSFENMIVTNALLLASVGVNDIENQFSQLRGSTFKNTQELIQASLKFFPISPCRMPNLK
jgi:hypothetical protein